MGTVEVRTTGHDPFLVGRLLGGNDDDRLLDLEYFCAAGVPSMQLFLGPPFTLHASCDLPDLPIAEAWQSYSAPITGGAASALANRPAMLRLDIGNKPDLRLQIRNLRVRPRNAKEIQGLKDLQQVRNAKIAEANRISNYLRENFSARIETVSVDANSIVLSGTSLPTVNKGARIRVVEYPAWHSVGEQQPGVLVNANVSTVGKTWHVQLPRIDSGRDRLHSSWRLATDGNEGLRFLTPRSFATVIKPEGDRSWGERMLPANQKGVAGVTTPELNDVIELGASAITINFVLNQFVSNRPVEPGQRIDTPGSALYFNRRAFDHYDKLLAWAREHRMVVSAIVLIASPREGTSRSPLVHPKTDGGHYAMPDLTSQRGAQVYAHVLRELAKRYSGDAKSHGQITNWIAHNEVDFHTVWTNMGRQPREIVTEDYYRSMRMIDSAARQFNPHARVFASLTHHWNVPDDGHWSQLAPRDVLEALQKYSDREGDFPWGLAYHPYPANLFAAVAWNDVGLRDDFETSLITIENLEVLGRFMQQDVMRDSSGMPRGVLLSEQGFHTDSYDPDPQARQAGSLLYAMQKVRKMPIIETFHYHRLVDAAGEGGLLLGLRTLASDGKPIGDKKRSWEVFQAIGTAREDVVTQDLPSP